MARNGIIAMEKLETDRNDLTQRINSEELQLRTKQGVETKGVLFTLHKTFDIMLP